MPFFNPLIAFSLDYDGCADSLAAHPYFLHPAVEPVKEQISSSLLADLCEKAQRAEKPEDVILFCGSNRQSTRFDTLLERQNKNGKAFEVLPRIASEHQWIYNPTILADERDEIVIPTPTGPRVLNLADLSLWGLDIKVLLLQKQLDELSSIATSRGKSAVMYFFDDDGSDSIFPRLLTAYEANELIIPENVTLNLLKHCWVENLNSYLALTAGKPDSCLFNAKAPVPIRTLTPKQDLCGELDRSLSVSRQNSPYFSSSSHYLFFGAASLVVAVGCGCAYLSKHITPR